MRIINNIITGLFLLPAICYWLIVGFIGLFLILIFGSYGLIVGGKNRQYVMNNLIGIDQLGNCIMCGDPDETISSRAGRRWKNSVWAKFINTLFFWQNNHVVEAIEKDENYEDDLIR